MLRAVCRTSPHGFVSSSCTRLALRRLPLLKYASTASSSSPSSSPLSAPSSTSSSASSSIPPKLKKPGPFKTQLRADRSSRIRVRPSAPDGQAIAFSTAESYDIDALRKALWNRGLLGRGNGDDAVNLMGEAIWVPKWPVDERAVDETSITGESDSGSPSSSGEVFIFESGAFVSWHMSESDAKAFADQVLRNGASIGPLASRFPGLAEAVAPADFTPVEVDRYKEAQTEAMDFIVKSGESTGVKGDVIVIASAENPSSVAPEAPETTYTSAPPLATAIHPPTQPNGKSHRASLLGDSDRSTRSQPPSAVLHPATDTRTVLPRSEDDLRARLSLSRGLARSTKLAVYEEMLDAVMDQVEHIPSILAKGSEGPLKKKDIIRNTGNLLRIRQYLYLNDENLIDMPEMFWSSPELEIWFKQMTTALDVDLRMRNLRTKLDYSLELQDTLLDLNSTKVSHRLEWIIIVLIAIEIALALIREGIPGLGKSKHEKEQHKLTEVPKQV